MKKINKFWSEKNTDYHKSASAWIPRLGEKEVNRLSNNRKQLFYNLNRINKIKKGTMIDWGCGGGINTNCFYTHFDNIIGVDVSIDSLKESSRIAETLNYKGFNERLINMDNPEKILDFNVKCDFFLATQVFMHFPNKNYAKRILNIIHNMLNDDGKGIIETCYNHETNLTEKFLFNWNNRVSYDIQEFWYILLDNGFKPLSVWIEPNERHAYYMFEKKENKNEI